jgi:hypothetical protein
MSLPSPAERSSLKDGQGSNGYALNPSYVIERRTAMELSAYYPADG